MIYQIGQLADIIDGDRGKNYPKQNEFFPEGYCLFLNAGNVTPNGFSFEENLFNKKGIKQDFYTLEAVDAVIAEYKRLEGDT